MRPRWRPRKDAVYCDEIEILGRKNVEGAAELSESTAVNDLYPQAFITPDQFDDTMRRIRAIREVVCQETME